MACIKRTQSGYRVDWRDREGNRYRRTFERHKDATDFLADVKVKQKAGTYVAPKRVPTFREVARQWFENKQGMKLRPSTLSCYRVNLDCHILPADFADAQLTAIEVADIEAFRNALSRKKTRMGQLSAKTVNYVLRDLDAIFAYAVKRRVASWNPVGCVERLKAGSEELVDGEANDRTDICGSPKSHPRGSRGLSPLVPVMKATDTGQRGHLGRWRYRRAHGAAVRRILAERQMNSIGVVIVEKLREQAPQVVFVEHDDMIEQLPPTGPHPTLGHPILPGTLNTRP